MTDSFPSNATVASHGSIPRFTYACTLALLTMFCGGGLFAQDSTTDALAAIKAVGKHGRGNEDAAAAMQQLNAATADSIPQLLEAFNGSTALQKNWLLGVVNQVAARGSLPRQAIEAYFEDRSNDPVGRLVAFDLLTQDDPSLRQQWIPKFIDDPSLPLRHKAIKSMVDKAQALQATDKDAAIQLLKQALDNALDVEQIQAVAKLLNKCDVKVDLQQTMGFLNRWQWVGTFDNTDAQGLHVAYGPEQDVTAIDTNDPYQTADGDKLARWLMTVSEDDTGVVDLNQVIGKQKDVSAYVLAAFNSPVNGAAEVRLGTPNAVKVWINGKLVLTNEVYHNSNSIDKFVAPVTLQQGPNEILMKVCQNDQSQPWAQDWQFQMRICGPDAKPILDQSLYPPVVIDQ